MIVTMRVMAMIPIILNNEQHLNNYRLYTVFTFYVMLSLSLKHQSEEIDLFQMNFFLIEQKDVVLNLEFRDVETFLMNEFSEAVSLKLIEINSFY